MLILDGIYKLNFSASVNFFPGKGTYKWSETGCIFDGDWKKGKRNGFGTYSRPDTKKKSFIKEYSGGWKNDMRHVCNIVYMYTV